MTTSALEERAHPSRGWLAAALSAADQIRLAPALIALFVASRVLIALVALVVENLLPPVPGFTPGASGPILSSLTSWDGFFYVDIASNGYQAAPIAGEYANIAFPPLYPALIRLVATPVPGFEGLVAVVISNVAFLMALGLLVSLGTPYVGRERALLAAGLLVIYPFASVFAMAYTESLFLLLMLCAFLAAERHHRAWAGIFLALAVLCRLQGVALTLPLFILLARQDEWRLRRSQGWLLLGPGAFVGFMLLVASITGSASGFLEAQEAWGREGIGGASAGETIAASLSLYQGALVLTLLWSVYLLVFLRVDRIRLEYGLIPVLFILAELSSGSLEAVGRITMLAFPYMWILANRRSLIARRIWPIVSVVLFTVVTFLSFAAQWVP